jgi:hypothetical protein
MLAFFTRYKSLLPLEARTLPGQIVHVTQIGPEL